MIDDRFHKYEIIIYNHLEFRIYYREMYYQLIYHIRYSIHYLISDFNKFLMKERIR